MLNLRVSALSDLIEALSSTLGRSTDACVQITTEPYVLNPSGLGTWFLHGRMLEKYMVVISGEEFSDLAAIQHVVNLWGHELGAQGVVILDEGIITADCLYNVGGFRRQGRDNIGDW